MAALLDEFHSGSRFHGQTGGHGGVFFIAAAAVGGDAGGGSGHSCQLIGQEVRFDFIATDIGQHLAIDDDARAEGLAAFLFHFPAKGWVFDDVFFFEWELVFAEHGAYALAPAAVSFKVGGDGRLIHGSAGGIESGGGSGAGGRYLTDEAKITMVTS